MLSKSYHVLHFFTEMHKCANSSRSLVGKKFSSFRYGKKSEVQEKLWIFKDSRAAGAVNMFA